MKLYALKRVSEGRKKIKEAAFDLYRDVISQSKNAEILATKLKLAVLEGHITQKMADDVLKTTQMASISAAGAQTETLNPLPVNDLQQSNWFYRWLGRWEAKSREKEAQRQLASQKISENSGSDFDFAVKDALYTIKSLSILKKVSLIGPIVVWLALTFLPKGENNHSLKEKLVTPDTSGVNFIPNMVIKDELSKIEKKQTARVEKPPVKQKAQKPAIQEQSEAAALAEYRRNAKRAGIVDISSIVVDPPKPEVIIEKKEPVEKPKRIRPKRTDAADNTDQIENKVR